MKIINRNRINKVVAIINGRFFETDKDKSSPENADECSEIKLIISKWYHYVKTKSKRVRKKLIYFKKNKRVLQRSVKATYYAFERWHYNKFRIDRLF